MMKAQTVGTRARLTNAASHLIFIIILFILPEVMMAIAMPHRNGFQLYPGFYFKTALYIAVFYINYLWLIDSTIAPGHGKSRLPSFILLNVGLIVVCLVLSWFASNVWFPGPPARHPHNTRHLVLKATSFLIRDGVMIILTITLSMALRLSSKWKDLQTQKQELIASQRAVELDNLKSQLNPHFLFNTLNTIYALIAVAPEKAQGAVHRLSGLLRYMLYEDDARVRLAQEAEFIGNYVNLMRLRLNGRNTELDINIAGHENDHVPPLLFIPLVENAFKYGVTCNDNTPIVINLSNEGNNVVCSTANAYCHNGEMTAPRSSGIGLANLRRRLTLIYGSEASLKTSSDGHNYTATLRIPL